MEQGVLGSSLTVTSRRGFLFSGSLGSSWLSHPFFAVWCPDFKVYSSTVGTTAISHVTLVTVWKIAHVASPSLKMLFSQGGQVYADL